MTTPNRAFTAIAIDDDELIRASLAKLFPDHWSFQAFAELPHNIPYVTLALTDIHLTNDHTKREGLENIKKISQKYPHAEIIAISGDMSREIMELALEAGASRYLLKPLSPTEIKLMIKKIENLIMIRQASQGGRHLECPWIGSSKSAEKIRHQVASLAGEHGPILIEGESGTGKEVIASMLFAQNPGVPQITVNVSSIPKNLFESELYGHVKGSFTGAIQNKIGLAEAAHGGDLFLDEIEALASTQQAKILRFLENGEVRKVGAQDASRVDVRVIAATNASLEEMVSKGEFREDLLWRLNGLKIKLPPLRDRKEDIPELFNFFMNQLSPNRTKELTPEAIQVLNNYNWPGNVRELKRVTHRLLVESPLPIIRAEDVEKIFFTSVKNANSLKIDLNKGLPDLLSDFESQVLKEALKQSEDVDSIARMLKISRSSLYKKVKDYGLELKGM